MLRGVGHGVLVAARTRAGEGEGGDGHGGADFLPKHGRAKSVRTSLILILKSPYGIAVIIAVLLNALIPFEKDEDEEEASKPKEVELTNEA